MLPMMESGCYNCPVKNCTAAYRGSECAANRAKVGIDTDPLTNGEYIRQADDIQLADVLCPACVYRAGCPEMHPCGDGKCFFDVLIDQTAGAVATTHIQDRYDAYNKFFYERRKAE